MCTSDISSHNYDLCYYNYMIFVDEVVIRLAVVSCHENFTFDQHVLHLSLPNDI